MGRNRGQILHLRRFWLNQEVISFISSSYWVRQGVILWFFSAKTRAKFFVIKLSYLGQGVLFLFRGAMYTLRFDIMPFSDQKWLRLGANFLLGTFCWLKPGTNNTKRKQGVILGQIFLTRGKKLFSVSVTLFFIGGGYFLHDCLRKL